MVINWKDLNKAYCSDCVCVCVHEYTCVRVFVSVCLHYFSPGRTGPHHRSVLWPTFRGSKSQNYFYDLREKIGDGQRK